MQDFLKNTIANVALGLEDKGLLFWLAFRGGSSTYREIYEWNKSPHWMVQASIKRLKKEGLLLEISKQFYKIPQNHLTIESK